MDLIRHHRVGRCWNLRLHKGNAAGSRRSGNFSVRRLIGRHSNRDNRALRERFDGINQRNESVLSAEHVIKVIPNSNDSRLT